jgi:hypothetical protein
VEHALRPDVAREIAEPLEVCVRPPHPRLDVYAVVIRRCAGRRMNARETRGAGA